MVISSQSPLTLPTELLELASLTVIHAFQSYRWYKHLSEQLPLSTAKIIDDKENGSGFHEHFRSSSAHHVSHASYVPLFRRLCRERARARADNIGEFAYIGNVPVPWERPKKYQQDTLYRINTLSELPGVFKKIAKIAAALL